jgi:redox-sensing transcriptional repressor
MARSVTREGAKRRPVAKTEKKMPRVVLKRLARYHQIAVRSGEEGQTYLSSASLANLVAVDATMVRKDMAAVGVTGRPKVGYFIGDVITRLGEVLGLVGTHDAVLIGCGSLGTAIARYTGFSRFGLKLVGIFDSDHAKVGKAVDSHLILPMEKCKSVIRIFKVKMAILTVPARVAQPTADWLVRQGIQGIWNFAPVDLRVPSHVKVRDENLAIGLAQLLYAIQQANRAK